MKNKKLLFLMLFSGSLIAQTHKIYCPNGGIEAEGLMRNEKKEGFWKFHECEGGTVMSEGNFKNDKKVGIWKHYDPKKGGISFIMPYVDGVEEGEYFDYFISGEIQTTCTYKGGKVVGERKTYFRNGSIELIENFFTGEIKRYYRNGQLEEIGNKNIESWRNEGEWRTYYENGKLKNIGKYEAGKQTGHWKEYYESGELNAEGEYRSEPRVGEWKLYHRNKVLRAVGKYNDEGYPIDGSWILYNKTGQKENCGCPEPTTYQLIEISLAIKNRVAAPNESDFNYVFEELLWKSACAEPGKDTREAGIQKVQCLWLLYKEQMVVSDLSGALAARKNLAKLLAEWDMLSELKDYNLDINFIDPTDGKTLLDFVKYVSEVHPLSKQPQHLHNLLRTKGAKYASELK